MVFSPENRDDNAARGPLARTRVTLHAEPLEDRLLLSLTPKLLLDLNAGGPSSNSGGKVPYDFTLLSGSLPANVIVGSTLPGSTYGQSVAFTVTVSGGGPTPSGTVQFVVDGSQLGPALTLSGGAATSDSTTLLGAGSHTVLAQYSGDANYAANTGSYTQVVNQAPLSIVPDNLSRAVGQSNPTLTYTFGGFVNGDTAGTSNITGTADLTTTAVPSSPNGSYPITVTDAGNLSSPNYDFPTADFASGTLMVTGGARPPCWWARPCRARPTASPSLSPSPSVAADPPPPARCSSSWTAASWVPP